MRLSAPAAFSGPPPDPAPFCRQGLTSYNDLSWDDSILSLGSDKTMQRTLVLLKPDCVHRRLVGTLLERFERKGLRLVGLKLVQASRQLAEQHYAVHKGKPFYESLLQFLTAGPTVAVVLEGREAVTVVRTLMGVTDGVKSPPGTIRGDYALSIQNNLIHGSDSPDNANSEIALWFGGQELVNYQPVDAPWVVG
jgi:nucleoside-diphosphate kinase